MADSYVYSVSGDDQIDVTVNPGSGPDVTFRLQAGSVLLIDRDALEALRPPEWWRNGESNPACLIASQAPAPCGTPKMVAGAET